MADEAAVDGARGASARAQRARRRAGGPGDGSRSRRTSSTYLYTDTAADEVPAAAREVVTYADPPVAKRDADGAITYRDALREALVEEMTRDARVILYGEDVADYGGAFKLTKGLLEAFGRERVFNTPISEACICGTAVGAAMVGLRPVVELMYMDFALMASDQIANQAGKWHYMSGAQVEVPLVIRASVGAGKGYGGQHSQSLESLFTHIPGLYVVYPATPADAKGLLKSAIRTNNPVLFVESQGLYPTKGVVPDGEHLVPIGVARVAREGTDATIVAWGPAVLDALTAAETLEAEHGLSTEVIDLRSLVPLDMETVLALGPQDRPLRRRQPGGAHRQLRERDRRAHPGRGLRLPRRARRAHRRGQRHLAAGGGPGGGLPAERRRHRPGGARHPLAGRDGSVTAIHGASRNPDGPPDPDAEAGPDDRGVRPHGLAQAGGRRGPQGRRPVRDRDRQVDHGRRGVRRRGPAQAARRGGRDGPGQRGLRLRRRSRARRCPRQPPAPVAAAVAAAPARRPPRPAAAGQAAAAPAAAVAARRRPAIEPRGGRRGRATRDQPARQPARRRGRPRSADHRRQRARTGGSWSATSGRRSPRARRRLSPRGRRRRTRRRSARAARRWTARASRSR